MAARKKVLNIIHFNDVYEIGARAKDPVGGVTRYFINNNIIIITKVSKTKGN